MSDCFLRVGYGFSGGELLNPDNSETGGLNYYHVEGGGGLECPGGFVGEVQLQGMASDPTNIGAWRATGGLMLGHKMPLFWLFYLRPELNGSFGASALNGGEGYIPIEGADLLAGGGLSVGIDLPITDSGSLELGLRPFAQFSPLRGYAEWGGGLTLTSLFVPKTQPPTPPPPCAYDGEKLESFYSLQNEVHKDYASLVERAKEYEGLISFLNSLNKFAKRINPHVEPWCSPLMETKSVQKEIRMPPKPLVWDFFGDCERTKRELPLAVEKLEKAKEIYRDWYRQFSQEARKLEKELEEILAWDPTCKEKFKPSRPRFLWFANDNPDIDLQPQWWREKGDRVEIHANPVLDEVLHFLAQHPDYQLGITTFANETGGPDRNKFLAEGRLKSILQYLTFQGVDRQRCFQKKDGWICEYQYQNDKSYREQYTEKGKRIPKYIGGAIASKVEWPNLKESHRFTLSADRIVWQEAMTPGRLEDPKIKELVKVNLPDKAMLDDPSSPFYRVAILTLVKKEEWRRYAP